MFSRHRRTDASDILFAKVQIKSLNNLNLNNSGMYCLFFCCCCLID